MHRDDRGATMVFVAILMPVLIAATGLGVDTGNMAYNRVRVQHSADAAALAIAFDCARNKACDVTTAASTANYFATKNSAGSDGNPSIAPAALSKASGEVTVGINKNVGTYFMRVLGTDSKDIGASATATWRNFPRSGPIAPFAVSLCEYLAKPVGTDTVVSNGINNASNDNFGLKGDADRKNPALVYAAMGPLMDQCDVPDDVRVAAELPGDPASISMLQGGLWLVNANNSFCAAQVVKKPTTILDPIDVVDSFNENCAKNYEPMFQVGDVILLAVYAPTANYEHGGIRLDTDGNVKVPQYSYDMRIVGYAPFEVSGVCFSKGNAVCGFSGKFTSTATPNPDFSYGADGTDFGAVKVALTK